MYLPEHCYRFLSGKIHMSGVPWGKKKKIIIIKRDLRNKDFFNCLWWDFLPFYLGGDDSTGNAVRET